MTAPLIQYMLDLIGLDEATASFAIDPLPDWPPRTEFSKATLALPRAEWAAAGRPMRIRVTVEEAT